MIGGAKIPQHTTPFRLHTEHPFEQGSREYHHSAVSVCVCEARASRAKPKGQESNRERRVDDDENRKKSIKTIRFSSKIHFHTSKLASQHRRKQRRDDYSTFSSTEKPTARATTNAARLRHHKQASKGVFFGHSKVGSDFLREREDTASISRRNQRRRRRKRGKPGDTARLVQREQQQQRYSSARNYTKLGEKHGFPDYVAANYR